MIRLDFAKLFNVERSERKVVGLLILLSFLIGTSLAFFYTASTALFMEAYGARMLSISFIAGGLTAYLAWQLLSMIDSALQPKQRVLFKMGFVGLITILLYGMQVVFSSPAIAFVLFTWVRVAVVVSLATFWSIAGRALNIKQGKRLFGLIGAGEVLSNVFGFFSIPLLLLVISTNDLLLCSGIGLLLTMLVIARLWSLTANQREQESKRISSPWQPFRSLWDILKNPYYAKLALLGILPLFGFLYVDFLFLEKSRSFFPEAGQLAAFLGKFLGAVAICELIAKTVLSSRLISWLGIKLGMMMQPLGLAGLFTLAWLGEAIMPAEGLALLFIALARLVDKVLQGAVYIPSNQLIFQSIDTKERATIQSTLEGALKPLGYATAGLVLLMFSVLGLHELGYYVGFFAVLAIAWAVLVHQGHKGYKDSLRRTLSEGLSKAGPAFFLFGTDYLKRVSQEDNMRAEISSWLIKESMSEPATQEKGEKDKPVPGALPNKLHQFEVAEPIMLISGYEGYQVPGPAALQEMVQQAAGIRAELQPLLEGKLMQLCSQQIMEAQAATPKNLEDILLATDQPALRTRLMELMANSRSEQAEQVLLDLLQSPSYALRGQAVSALAYRDFRCNEQQRPAVNSALDSFSRNLAWHMAALSDLGHNPQVEVVRHCLEREIESLKASLLSILALIYGSTSISVVKARLDFNTESAENHAFAIELLENLLLTEHKDIIIPFFDDQPLSSRLKQINKIFPQQALTDKNRLAAIISRSPAQCSDELRSAALLSQGQVVAQNMRKPYLAALFDPKPQIHESALQASKKLLNKEKKLANRLPKEVQAKLPILLDQGQGGLTAIQIVDILAKIPIFKGLERPFLFSLASLFKLKRCQNNAVIYGEHYLNAVFIVVSGTISAQGLMPIKDEYLDRRLFIFGATNNGIERIDIHQGAYYLKADRVAFFNLLVQESVLLEHLLSKVA